MGELGNFLKASRNRFGYSLAYVERKTGITDSVLSRIENGKNKSAPAASLLMKLANLYDINLIELYIVAGYLDDGALSSYKQVFHNMNLLTIDERNHIQELIYLFTKGRK